MARPDWFELSHEGWQQRSRSRPLGRLLLEAVQNAFDAAARSVRVTLDERAIHVEDDASEGFADGRLVYTVFLSDKRGDPAKRGRLGRGLKELIAAMERARVETVGTTVTSTPRAAARSRTSAEPGPASSSRAASIRTSSRRPGASSASASPPRAPRSASTASPSAAPTAC